MLRLLVRVLLGHWEGELEGEPVSERLPLGEREGLRVAHAVVDCVQQTVPLSEVVTEMLSEAVGPAGELDGEAEPAAAPKVALGLVASLALVVREGERVEEANSEAVKLTLEEKEPLAEEHGVLDWDAHWVPVEQALLLTLRVPEAEEQAEPRLPNAAAPPEALGLAVKLTLPVPECDAVKEPLPEAVKLALEEMEPLKEAH